MAFSYLLDRNTDHSGGSFTDLKFLFLAGVTYQICAQRTVRGTSTIKTSLTTTYDQYIGATSSMHCEFSELSDLLCLLFFTQEFMQS